MTDVNTNMNHEEKLKKFNELNFKKWLQKMLFYLTTMNVLRFLANTTRNGDYSEDIFSEDIIDCKYSEDNPLSSPKWTRGKKCPRYRVSGKTTRAIFWRVN